MIGSETNAACCSIVDTSPYLFLRTMAENDDALMKPAVSDELEPEQKRKVFIGSLSYRIEESVFREYWTQFGTVL